jgi:hypothetical protein
MSLDLLTKKIMAASPGMKDVNPGQFKLLPLYKVYWEELIKQ